jgi:hypothetical protein
MRAACLSVVVGLLIGCGVSCIPVADNVGGTLPPPTVGPTPTLPDPNTDPNPGESGGGRMIFDVSIVASSLALNGINVDGTLTVETSADGVVEGVTLADNDNDPASIIGLSGGLFLTTGSSSAVSSAGLFVLSARDDGTVSAVLTGAGGGASGQSRFILQADGDVFDQGVVGITYAVESGSRFSFLISGDTVAGQIDLNGNPIDEAAGADVYVGTFTGTLRSAN